MSLIKLRSILFFLLILGSLVGFSCKRNSDKVSSSTNDKLSFSSTEVFFDTIFTSVGSITKRLWVYNPNTFALNISSIELAGGMNSPFEILKNGEALLYAEQVNLKGKDSMMLLVRVNIDPQNTSLPYLVHDSLLFRTNGNLQQVDLMAYGQDAEFITNATLPCATTWTNSKPYVITGTVTVPAGCMLTIQKGTRVLFHSNGLLKVDGTLIVNGEKDSLVTFKHDNLLNFYKDVPGQWQGIQFSSGSKNNTFLFAQIINPINGITLVEESDGDTIAEVLFQNSILKNCSANGVTASNSDFVAVNSEISNCIGYLVEIKEGGNFYFDFCSLVNYSFDFFRDGPILKASNDNGSISNPLTLRLRNTILWGDKTEEIETNDNGVTAFDFKAHYSFLRTGKSIAGVSTQFNVDPLFESVFLNNYSLKSSSPAIDNALILPLITDDQKGNTRDASPDIGCYEKL